MSQTKELYARPDLCPKLFRTTWMPTISRTWRTASGALNSPMSLSVVKSSLVKPKPLSEHIEENKR